MCITYGPKVDTLYGGFLNMGSWLRGPLYSKHNLSHHRRQPILCITGYSKLKVTKFKLYIIYNWQWTWKLMWVSKVLFGSFFQFIKVYSKWNNDGHPSTLSFQSFQYGTAVYIFSPCNTIYIPSCCITVTHTNAFFLISLTTAANSTVWCRKDTVQKDWTDCWPADHHCQ